MSSNMGGVEWGNQSARGRRGHKRVNGETKDNKPGGRRSHGETGWPERRYPRVSQRLTPSRLHSITSEGGGGVEWRGWGGDCVIHLQPFPSDAHCLHSFKLTARGCPERNVGPPSANKQRSLSHFKTMNTGYGPHWHGHILLVSAKLPLRESENKI